jgi:signal transduction histidine kinase
MEDLSLHILDIVENSVVAEAKEVRILIVEETAEDKLSLEIRDDGKGMDEQMRKKALDPFFTTRTTRRVGLGLPLLAQAARDSGGSLELSSAPGRGTLVKAEFQLSHPDRKPLGDVVATLGAIVAGRPELVLVFEYRKDGEVVAILDSSRPPQSKSE